MGSSPILGTTVLWRSGYAAVCKTAYTGSIPVGTSKEYIIMQYETKDRIIDGVVKALKAIGHSNLLFGTFLIAEGLSLIFAPSLFPIFITLSILIAYAFAIEWFFNVIRGEKTLWNIIQRVFIVIIIIALLVYCGFMIFDEVFRLSVDRVIVSATTIGDGSKNLYQSFKIEKRRRARLFFSISSGLAILYGVIYAIVGGAEANIFTTTIHGVIFVLCGLTNLWFYIRNRRPSQNLEKTKTNTETKTKTEPEFAGELEITEN